MATFRERLIEALRVREITASELANRSGLSKPRLSQYINGVYEPKQSAIKTIAETLHISIPWLMGYDVPMEESKNSVEVTSQEMRMLRYYRALNEIGKAKAIGNLYDLSKNDDLTEEGDANG